MFQNQKIPEFYHTLKGAICSEFLDAPNYEHFLRDMVLNCE